MEDSPHSFPGPSGLRLKHLQLTICRKFVGKLRIHARGIFVREGSSRDVSGAYTPGQPFRPSELKPRPVTYGDVLRLNISDAFFRLCDLKLGEKLGRWELYGMGAQAM